MRTLLATKQPRVDQYIITTHQDILILAQEESAENCLEATSLHKPELVIACDSIISPGGLSGWEEELAFIEGVKKAKPGVSLLWLITGRTLTAKQDKELREKGVWYLQSPITGQALSRVLYDISSSLQKEKGLALVALWSPKPGEGVSFTAEAVAHLFWNKREHDEEKIGLLDFNIKTPCLKYRLGLDECQLLDDLLPYIGAASLTPEILDWHALPVEKKEGLRFVGGIQRPEFYDRYTAAHFNILLAAAGKLFARTVVDAGSLLDNAGTITALKNADLILTVLQPTYVSKQCLKHALSLFPALGINPNKLGVVFNRYTQADEEPRVILTGLNVEVAGTLPDLGPAANHLDKASLWGEADGRHHQAYCDSLQDILEQYGFFAGGERKPKSRLGRLFPRGRKNEP